MTCCETGQQCNSFHFPGNNPPHILTVKKTTLTMGKSGIWIPQMPATGRQTTLILAKESAGQSTELPVQFSAIYVT